MHNDYFPDILTTAEAFVTIDETLLEVLRHTTALEELVDIIQEDMREFTTSCRGKTACVQGIPKKELKDLSNELDTVSYKKKEATLCSIMQLQLVSKRLISPMTSISLITAKSKVSAASERVSTISGLIADSFIGEGNCLFLASFTINLCMLCVYNYRDDHSRVSL